MNAMSLDSTEDMGMEVPLVDVAGRADGAIVVVVVAAAVAVA